MYTILSSQYPPPHSHRIRRYKCSFPITCPPPPPAPPGKKRHVGSRRFRPWNAQKEPSEEEKIAPENCHRLQCKGLFNIADLVNGMWKVAPPPKKKNGLPPPPPSRGGGGEDVYTPYLGYWLPLARLCYKQWHLKIYSSCETISSFSLQVPLTNIQKSCYLHVLHVEENIHEKTSTQNCKHGCKFLYHCKIMNLYNYTCSLTSLWWWNII